MLQKMQAAEVEKLLTKVTDQNKLRLLRFYVEGYQLVKKGYKILDSDFNHILQRHSSGTMDKVDKFLQGADIKQLINEALTQNLNKSITHFIFI